MSTAYGGRFGGRDGLQSLSLPSTQKPIQRRRQRQMGDGFMPNIQFNEAGAMVYSCPRCAKLLGRDYYRHMRECGMEPAYQCPFCEHRTKRSDNLRTHMRRVHKAEL